LERLVDSIDDAVPLAGSERQERPRERPGVGEPFLGSLSQATLDDRGERFGHVRAQLRDRTWVLLEDGGEDLTDAFAVERDLSGQQLVHDDAERPDVRPGVDALRASQLLRCDVRGRPEDRVTRELLLAGAGRRLLRDPEVQNFEQW